MKYKLECGCEIELDPEYVGDIFPQGIYCPECEEITLNLGPTEESQNV